MVFSSISFLFFFLPILLAVYYVSPRKIRNYVLLLFSLIFYYLGEKWNVLILSFSCLMNFGFGIMIEKYKNKTLFILGIASNIGVLFYFKYTNFFLSTIFDIFKLEFSPLKIVLPLGISFTTFQNLSYLVDVYRGDQKAQKNCFKYATYITMFPQLVAGPIVRYQDVLEYLEGRKETLSKFSDGVIRLIIGLAKKILIADVIYDMYSSVSMTDLSTVSYFLIAICFTLQIYYDFSGYSDMAIGLGKMFGFDFKENFDYPLTAYSITDFWRRWHISLSSFFKDYVYIPLGGSRGSVYNTIKNILIVWLLTGLWHGANWNFVLWGFYFFVFLILEKFVLKSNLKDNLLSHLYTFLVVIVSFVIFNTEDLSEILSFLKGMFGMGVPFINRDVIFFFRNNFVILVIAFLGISPYLKNKIENLKKGKFNKVIELGSLVSLIGAFLLVIMNILSSSFNPFIYFRF